MIHLRLNVKNEKISFTHLSLRAVNHLLLVSAVGLQACTPTIQTAAPSSTTGTTTNASVTDLGALNVTQSFVAGYYSSANSSSLPVSSVCNTTSIFGSSGTATCMTGSLTTPASTSDVLAGKNYFDGSGTVQTGTLATRTLSSASTTVTAGYYAATTLTAVEANLVSGNIKAGTSIFGVGGNSNVVDTSSGDAVLGEILSGKKAFVGGSLVTGSMANQSTWDARTAFPGAGYFAGISNTLSTSQVCSAATGGINFLGSAGTAVCLGTSGGANATASNVLSGTYFWDSTGTSTQGTMADQSNSWDLTTAFPGAGYYSGVSSALAASDICSSKSFLGAAGTAICGGVQVESNACRNVGTTQITVSSEASTYAGSGGTPSLPSGYRDTPDVNKDDDGYYNADAGCTSNCSPIISVTAAQHAAFVDCGTTQTSIAIAARIADCVTQNGSSATWNGQKKGTHGESTWSLVTHLGTNKEVWQDQKTGLIWSSIVIPNAVLTRTGGDNWCRGAGNAQSDDSSGYCNTTTYQPEYPTAESYCSEDAAQVAVPGWCDNGVAYATSAACTGAGGTWTANTEDYTAGTYQNAKGGMGANSATLKIRWRLPTKWDYQQADNDGIRSVMPDMGAWSNGYEWSASVLSYNRFGAWIFNGVYGYSNGLVRAHNLGVRCVGR